MKLSIKHILLIGLGVVLLGVGIYVAKLVWFRPFNINHFYERVFIEFMLEEPELLSRIQVRQLKRFRDYDSELSDASVAHQKKLARMMERDLEILESYNDKEFEGQDRLSYDILHWFLAHNVAGDAYQFHNYPVNQFSGVQQELPSFMVSVHQMNSSGAADAYLRRLRLFPQKFDQLISSLKYREEQGIIPPRFVVEKVLEEMNDFIETPIDSNILYTSFVQKMVRIDVTDVGEVAQLSYLNKLETSMREYVYPAYRSLIAYHEELLPKTSEQVGVWQMPEGDAFYEWALRGHTTTDLSAAEVHQIGLDEVARLEQEIRQALDSLGHQDTSKSVGDWMLELAQEERFLYPDTDSGKQLCLAEYEKLVEEANQKVEGLFIEMPDDPIEVKAVPAFREETSAGAYYEASALDGSRPGTFYVNLRDIREIPKWGMRTLVYHEAIPGHHFQIAFQQAQENLPTFRRVLPFTAYTEGWALYSEQAMTELGMHYEAYSVLGYLQWEMVRAVRLVVDTGIHSKKWTREQAIEYMKQYTGLPEKELVAEVERYIVNPGQACAYKIGQLKILELRKKAQDAIGLYFRVDEFHDLILRNGAMPLDILERLVDEYIEEKVAEKS